MLYDPLKEFTKNLNRFLTGNDEAKKGKLIKKHSNNLQAHGEFSFPNTIGSWHKYVNKHKQELNNCNFLTYIEKNPVDITNSSENWNISIKTVILINDRVHLFINRTKAIQLGLECSLTNNNWISQKLNTKEPLACVDAECDGPGVTSLRLKCLMKSINCLLAINSKNLSGLTKIVISSKSPNGHIEGLVLCGAVLNIKTNIKENTIDGLEFIKLRQNELTLIAQHKYGVRVTDNAKWKEFIAHLGESAVTFELLQTKPSCAVKINFDVSSGSSKGAAFVLYNCARLETIIRTYNERVAAGYYPPLPCIEHIDFTLLNQEEEWCLVFNYVLALPSLLENCVEVQQHAVDARPHLLCGYLTSMVKVISQYYRRTRILTEPRQHLLPVMFARLHLLTAVNQALKTCLTILNIKSVSQMYNQFYCYTLLNKGVHKIANSKCSKESGVLSVQKREVVIASLRPF